MSFNYRTMNKNKILLITIIIFSIGILYNSCKKKDENKDNTPNDLEQKLTTNMNTLHDAAVLYADKIQQSGDSIAAFVAMKNQLTESPEVSGGWFHNLEYLEVEFANGLKSPINIIPVSDSGEHLSRGGGSANSLEVFNFKKVQTKDIKNNKVLVLLPYPHVFFYSSTDIQNLKASFQGGSQELDVDVEVGNKVDLQDLDRLGDYGFIILDVHGTKHGFFLAFLEKEYDSTEIWFPEEEINEVFNVHTIPPEKIANGQIEIGLDILYRKNGRISFSFNILITEDYIRQLNVDMSDAIVFGNHCYSGHTADGPNENNLPQAWRSRGVATYYGYALANQKSLPVDNDFSKAMERLLIKGLVADGDTTGSANLYADGSVPFFNPSKNYRVNRYKMLEPIGDPAPPSDPLYFNQFFDKDYKYPGCGGELVDERDHQVYKTVCIGDQVWMAENLRYEVPGSKVPEGKDISIYGRLYDYNTITAGGGVWEEGMEPIQGICPDNWHVPHRDDWKYLIKELGGEPGVDWFINNDAIGKATIQMLGQDPSIYNYDFLSSDPLYNSSGFSSLSTGLGVIPDGSNYEYRSDDGRPFFWSSSPLAQELDGDGNPTGEYDTESRWGLRIIPGLYFELNITHPTVAEKYYPCRCVKDK
jgi:uncharacterized protein (TIGR02145 family)